jgi:nuclear pore complex protein Nup62
MYVFMYVYVCIYVSLCMYLYMFMYVFIYVYACLCVFMYVFMPVCVYLCIYLCMFMYVCVCIYVFYVCIYACLYMYICMYVCMRDVVWDNFTFSYPRFFPKTWLNSIFAYRKCNVKRQTDRQQTASCSNRSEDCLRTDFAHAAHHSRANWKVTPFAQADLCETPITTRCTEIPVPTKYVRFQVYSLRIR